MSKSSKKTMTTDAGVPVSDNQNSLTADRYDHRDGNDDYTQTGDLYRLMSVDQKAQLIGNIVRSMKQVPKDIQQRQISHFRKADKDYGDRVASGLGLL
ncbi:MAG: catalase-related domain-containing protein [bacterium]